MIVDVGEKIKFGNFRQFWTSTVLFSPVPISALFFHFYLLCHGQSLIFPVKKIAKSGYCKKHSEKRCFTVLSCKRLLIIKCLVENHYISWKSRIYLRNIRSSIEKNQCKICLNNQNFKLKNCSVLHAKKAKRGFWFFHFPLSFIKIQILTFGKNQSRPKIQQRDVKSSFELSVL